MEAAAGPQRRQEITLLQERSAGTFARVYLAEANSQDGISRIVAVKILKTQWSSDPELLNRTHDEARLLARLHHRNILRVEALAELSGQPAIIMEFVDGVDLKQIIERTQAPIPPRAAYRIIRDTAAALEAAYFRAPYGRDEPLRVIHRDIKPSNVMVSVEGDVKVLDFGTARYQNEIRLAQTGALRFGSLKYMSPERRAGDRGEHASDVYSLGVLLLELLLGELLPVMPLDQQEHDEALDELVGRVHDLGLPNAEWETSLRQTMLRMCAYHASHRLDAQQVVQLMRAFADQATGHSLDSYAADTVDQLSREIFANKPKGDFSGQRLSVSLTSSGSTPKTQAPTPQPEPVPAPAPEPAQQPVMEDTATVTDPVYAEQFEATVQQEAAHDSGPSFTGGHDFPASGPSFGDPAPEPVSIGYGNASSASAPDPEPEPQRNLMLIGAAAAAIGVMFAFGLAAILGFGYYYLLHKDAPEPTPDITFEPLEPVVTSAGPADAASATITITAGDESIQWIKLASADGDTLFKADPSNSAALAPGTYTLTAKVVARPKATGTIELTDVDISLTCVPGEQQTVTCDSGDGTITLAP